MAIRMVSRTCMGLFSILLVGCATTEQNASLECGLGGVAAGYLACKLAGGNDAKCLAIGGGVGGAAAVGCYSYSKHLAARRQQLAGKENDLDAQIKYVQGLNNDTKQLNGELNKRLASVTQKNDQVLAQIQQQQISYQQLAQERQSQDKLIAQSQQEVDDGVKALQTAKDLRARRSTAAPDLDAAIDQQEQLLVDAHHQVELLSQQRARV